MAKYKTKPCVIEAIQWTGKNANEIAQFTQGKLIKGVFHNDFIIYTRGDDMRVNVGDYIIKENGKYYPCKPDIFKKKYELTGHGNKRSREVYEMNELGNL